MVSTTFRFIIPLTWCHRDRLHLIETSRQMCRDHHQHSEVFQYIDRIHVEKYHPCPWWFVLSSTTLLPSLQHKLDCILCYTLSSLLSSFCSVPPWSITIFISRIPWELHTILWTLDTVILLASLFIPRSPCCGNRNAGRWTMMCEINTPSLVVKGQ